MLLLQQKQDAVASTPPSPQLFIAAQLVSLPVFILVCTIYLFIYLHTSILCFLAEKFLSCPDGDDDPNL